MAGTGSSLHTAATLRAYDTIDTPITTSNHYTELPRDCDRVYRLPFRETTHVVVSRHPTHRKRCPSLKLLQKQTSKHNNMASLEAAIDEEMREVVGILEGKQKSGGRRPESPAARTRSPGSPTSPLRSMLDVDDVGQRRSTSRNSTGIPFVMPTSSSRRINPESAYRFDTLPSIDAQARPKRVSQGGKLDATAKPRAMSSVYGTSSGFLGSSNSRDRHSMSGPLGRSKSGSPGPDRSASPASRMMNPTSPAPTANKTFVTDSGKHIDANTAYRKLSDSALTNSEKGLSSLSASKSLDPPVETDAAPGGGVRLTTDDDGDDSAAVESSDNDSDSSDWDDGWAPTKKGERGRQRTRKESGGVDSMGRDIVTAKSLLAAAEEERKSCMVHALL